jgi:hypothetical protein
MILADGMIATFEIPPGRFYGPCSGQDLSLALHLFGKETSHFVFCDLAYRGGRSSAQYVVPQDWSLLSRIHGADTREPEKITWYAGNRPIRPHATIEVWRRPDGSEVNVELRRDLAQDVLIKRFTAGTISGFMHINDSPGEGGSDLWFLALRDAKHGQSDIRQGFLQEVATRLCCGAIVITDGVLADPLFTANRTFDLGGKRWELLGEVPNQRRLGRQLRMWRAIDLPTV